VLHPQGYLMHKYRADGAVGSSWHPYLHEDGTSSPPIQEDETALVLFVFNQFYQMHEDDRLLREFYTPMIRPMANFLAGFIDETTGLPKPSYDLWEEHYLTTTYTTSVVYAALLAAADLAEISEDSDSAVAWRSAADDISTAAHKHLYNANRKSFYKGLLVKDGQIEHDTTIDTSSIFGAFMFGLFPVGSEELQSAVATLKETFHDEKNIIGLPRYENDWYRRVDGSETGNWWIITTLWMAQYAIETNDVKTAQKVVDWVSTHATSTGILPEQLSPLDESSVSVAPLSWSHAEYLATLLDMIAEK